MMKEVIDQILKSLSEGKLKEAQELIIRNVALFPKDVQVEILTSIIEGKLLEKIQVLEKINSLLESGSKTEKE